MMAGYRWILLIVFGVLSCGQAKCQDLMSDTWVGTDALGRRMPTSDEVGLPKTDKQRIVGMFYITWHDEGLHHVTNAYRDVSQVLDIDPDARINGNAEAWGKGIGMWHWGEPEYGYFLSRDKYVILHDISMLVDAGVDVLIMDVTNAIEYWKEWQTLFDTMEEMKQNGNRVPKICFWAFNGPVISVVQDIYDKFYKQGKYKDLWFYWLGKPLILCNMTPTVDSNGPCSNNPNRHYEAAAATDVNHPHYGNPDYAKPFYEDYTQEVKAFFTMRNMWWGNYEWAGKRYVGTEDAWSFGYEMGDKRVASLSPSQRAATHEGRLEQMAVTPAQHPISMTGKSWRIATQEPTLDEHDSPKEAYVPWLGKTVESPEGYGIYFQDRWDEALQVDPDFLYLNDWNEWTAGKYVTGKAPNTDDPGPTSFLGRDENTFYFVDQYNAEFNRTIQPVKGRYTDNYYMQMAQNIRRYKGVRPIPENVGFFKMKVDGCFEDWENVSVKYLDTKGDVIHRDHNGYAGHHYVNKTGRNDIVESKVAVDRKNVYFYVRTDQPMTPSTEPNWMLLLIDADKNGQTGWYGYDFLLNRKVKDAQTTVLMTYSEVTKEWVEVAEVSYGMKGNEMELAVPKKMLKTGKDEMTFDFKWIDNPQSLTTPISLCTDGDAAPNRRFNYRFIWRK